MKTITYNLPISENLYNILKDYIYETEFDENSYSSVDDFIIAGIVEKLNNENEIFSRKIDENGFVNK